MKKDSDWNDSSRLLELSHSGDSENAALLLSKLVTSGAKISSYTKQSKVEDLFLEVESGRMEKGGESESTHPQGNPRGIRIKHLIASALFSLIITTTLYLSTYLNGMQERRHYDFATKQSPIIEENPINGARNAFTYLLAFRDSYSCF